MDFCISIKAAAKLIGCSEDTIKYLKKCKILYGKTVKGVLLLNEDSVKAFVRAKAMIDGGDSKDDIQPGRPVPSEKEYEVLTQLIKGDDLETIADRMGLTPERISQIANKAILKVNDCVERDLYREHIEHLEQENKFLRNHIETLKRIMQGYEERLGIKK